MPDHITVTPLAAAEFAGFFTLRSVLDPATANATGSAAHLQTGRQMNKVRVLLQEMADQQQVPLHKIVRDQAKGGKAVHVSALHAVVAKLRGDDAVIDPRAERDVREGILAVPDLQPGQGPRHVALKRCRKLGFFRVAPLGNTKADKEVVRILAQNMALEFGADILNGGASCSASARGGVPLEMHIAHLDELLRRMRCAGLGQVQVDRLVVADIRAEAQLPEQEEAPHADRPRFCADLSEIDQPAGQSLRDGAWEGHAAAAGPSVGALVLQNVAQQDADASCAPVSFPDQAPARADISEQGVSTVIDGDSVGNLVGKLLNNLQGVLEVRRYQESGMFDLTLMCRTAHKEFKHFKYLIFEGRTFQQMCECVAADEGLAMDQVLLEGAGINGGSLGCRTLAVKVARWCVPRFADAADRLVGHIAERCAGAAGATGPSAQAPPKPQPMPQPMPYPVFGSQEHIAMLESCELNAVAGMPLTLPEGQDWVTTGAYTMVLGWAVQNGVIWFKGKPGGSHKPDSRDGIQGRCGSHKREYPTARVGFAKSMGIAAAHTAEDNMKATLQGMGNALQIGRSEFWWIAVAPGRDVTVAAKEFVGALEAAAERAHAAHCIAQAPASAVSAACEADVYNAFSSAAQTCTSSHFKAQYRSGLQHSIHMESSFCMADHLK